VRAITLTARPIEREMLATIELEKLLAVERTTVERS
jgi:hypothetical protein